MTVSRTRLPQALAKGKVISLWVNFSFFGCYSSKKAATLASLFIDEPMRALDYARPQVQAMCTYIRHM